MISLVWIFADSATCASGEAGGQHTGVPILRRPNIGFLAHTLGFETGAALRSLRSRRVVTGKAGLFIFMVFWVRASVPRLRIDQLMSFTWKILLPLMFAQVLINGLVLVYDWPEIVLTVTGLVGVLVLVMAVDRAVRHPRPRPAPATQLEGEAAS